MEYVGFAIFDLQFAIEGIGARDATQGATASKLVGADVVLDAPGTRVAVEVMVRRVR